MKRLVSAVAVVLLAASASAQEPDAAARAMAQEAIDAQPYTRDRTKMRIVWPEAKAADPPVGAEALLIDGYVSYLGARLVWRGDRVEATAVNAARTWFYNAKGESFAAWTFDVDSAEFVARWRAASLLAKARLERVAPAEESNGWSGVGVSSHAPHHWLRLRSAPTAEPEHCATDRGGSTADDQRQWVRSRHRALFGLMRSLVPDKAKFRPTSLETWGAYCADVIAEETPRLDVAYDRPQPLLLKVALRVAGEAGPESAAASVEELDARLAGQKREEFDSVEDVRAEAEIARAKLRLRFHFDVAAATELIHGNPRTLHWQNDLANWARVRFRAAAPDDYFHLLAADLLRNDDADLRFETQRDVERIPADAVAAGFGPLLTSKDTPMRFAAASALLLRAPGDAPALDAMESVAADADAAPPKTWDLATWPRARAAEVLARVGRWNAESVRKRLGEPADGAWTKALLDALRTRDVVEREFAVRVHLRALDLPTTWGTYVSCAELIELGDAAAWPKVDAAFDRLAKTPVADAPSDALALLRARLGEARARAK